MLGALELFFKRSVIKWTDLIFDDDGILLFFLEGWNDLGIRSEIVQGIDFPMFGEDNLVLSRPTMIDEIIHFCYRFLDFSDIIFAFRIYPILLEIYKHQCRLCHLQSYIRGKKAEIII